MGHHVAEIPWVSRSNSLQGFLDFALFLQVPFANSDEFGIAEERWVPGGSAVDVAAVLVVLVSKR